MHTVVAFDFDNVEDEIIKDVVCPLCGGQIKKTSFGYGCVNYKGDEPGSCRFSVGQIAGKTITAAHLSLRRQRQMCIRDRCRAKDSEGCSMSEVRRQNPGGTVWLCMREQQT